MSPEPEAHVELGSFQSEMPPETAADDERIW